MSQQRNASLGVRPIGIPAVSLVLDTAVELPAGGNAFAPRQVHAAVLAAHHVFHFPAPVRIRPVDAPPIRLQHGIRDQHTEQQEDDFCQGITRSTPSEALRENGRGSQFADCVHRPSRNFDGNSLFVSSPARRGRLIGPATRGANHPYQTTGNCTGRRSWRATNEHPAARRQTGARIITPACPAASRTGP